MAEVDKLSIEIGASSTEAISRIEKLKGTLNSLRNVKIGGNVSSQLKEMNRSLKKTGGMLDNFYSSLKRIAMYRVLRTIIKEITQAFKEGLENAYAFSQGITTEGSRFATAMDSMSSAGLKMKNQLGSAFIALLTAIAPAVNTIISLVTQLANAMSQLFAVFSGGTYLKANDVTAQFADNMKKGGKAAREWKNQVLGFDEINKLNEPSGGGGGGAAALDPSQMFTDTPIEGIFAKIKAKVDELKESLDFSKLSGSWDRLKTSVQGLADVVLQGLSWAWDNVLEPLAHWTIEQAAPALVSALASAFNLLAVILEELSPVFDWLWQNILQPVFKFIGTVAVGALKALDDLMQDLADLISGKISFKEFISGLSTAETVVGGLCLALGWIGLIGLLEHLKNVALVGVFLAIGKVSTALSFLAANPTILAIAAIAAIVTAIVLLVKHWDEITGKIKEWYNELKEKLTSGSLEFGHFSLDIIGLIDGIVGAIKTLVSWCRTAISWLKDLFTTKDEGSYSLDLGNGRTYNYNPNKPGLFASGGFPEDGLFFANHGELVGEFSNGRTAVANNEQITEGIANAVYGAFISAFSQTGGSGGGDKTIVMNVNGREFMRAVYNDYRAVANERGVSLVVGG